MRRALVQSGLLVSLIWTLAGCAAEPAEPPVPQAVMNSGYKEKLLGAQAVADRLAAEGVPMQRDAKARVDRLNAAHPLVFELAEGDQLRLYMYDSPRSVKRAKDDFVKQAERMNGDRSFIYAFKNILLVYRAPNAGESEPRTGYDEAIGRAVSSLLGDEVVFGLSKTYNPAKLERFLASVRSGQPDQIKVTTYTIEGDPIWIYGIWDGAGLKVVRDTSMDRYGGQAKEAVRTDCTGLVQTSESSADGSRITRYTATGCTGTANQTDLAVVRN